MGDVAQSAREAADRAPRTHVGEGEGVVQILLADLNVDLLSYGAMLFVIAQLMFMGEELNLPWGCGCVVQGRGNCRAPFVSHPTHLLSPRVRAPAQQSIPPPFALPEVSYLAQTYTSAGLLPNASSYLATPYRLPPSCGDEPPRGALCAHQPHATPTTAIFMTACHCTPSALPPQCWPPPTT